MITYQSIKPYQKAAIARQTERAETIKAMAATMQDMEATGEAVTPKNLELHGYSPETIMHLAVDAAHLARQLSVKRVQA